MNSSKYEKLTWKLSCVIPVITTAILFIPALSGIYSSYGRYAIYVGFILGIVSTVLAFKSAAEIGAASGYVMATIKCLVFSCIFVVAYTIFAVTHSGI